MSSNASALAGRLARHMVPVIDYETGGRSLWTTFALSVRETWYLATAGHCATEAAAVPGLNFSTMVGNFLIAPQTCPFHFQGASKKAVGLDLGLDFCAVALEERHRAFLEKCGVVALTERHWKRSPFQPVASKHVFCGFPAAGTASSRFTFAIHEADIVDLCAGSPEIFALLERDTGSLCGMSGAPLFAVAADGSYWLRGIFSASHRSGDVGRFAPIQPLGLYIQRLDDRAVEAEMAANRKERAASTATATLNCCAGGATLPRVRQQKANS